MKYKVSILIGTVIASLFLSLSFGVGKVHATTGCFTDTIGHPFETFICWMLEKGITSGTAPGLYSPEANVTRGQMAVFMKRQAEIPPTTGDTHINTGPSGWVTDAQSSTSYIWHFPYAAALRASATGTHTYDLSPSLPSSLYNTQMLVKGVKLCYEANHGATINVVSLAHYSGGIIFNMVEDYTVRSDATCRTYLMSAPSEFWGSDQVTLVLTTTFTTVDQWISITSATFILSPSVYPAVLSPVGARPVPADAEPVP